MAFAEEILVTKSDLEEKTQSMAELKTKVEELTMQSEYQLRLKDLNYNEKLKEATEKFTQERGCHCHCPHHRHLLHLHSPPTSSTSTHPPPPPSAGARRRQEELRAAAPGEERLDDDAVT